ncbi:hypothetical protein GFL69_25335 [Rhizobium leguminosarum bv. viciae]|nr:hypothetical protein [Rhizobium leguminosarum bv. viciae]
MMKTLRGQPELAANANGAVPPRSVSRSARQPSDACHVDRRLIPASPAVPAAAAQQKKYHNDDEKGCEIHVRSPGRTITISFAPDGRCSWWDSLAYNGAGRGWFHSMAPTRPAPTKKACLTSLETPEKTYGHHHPDHQANVGAAFTTGRAGRKR